MPIVTPADTQLLTDLARHNVTTIGRPRIKELTGLCWRLINGAQEAESAAAGSDFLANALWLAAAGKLTEQMIAEQPRLADEQKADLLAILQMRYDAMQWREYTGFELPSLPTATLPQPVQDAH